MFNICRNIETYSVRFVVVIDVVVIDVVVMMLSSLMLSSLMLSSLFLPSATVTGELLSHVGDDVSIRPAVTMLSMIVSIMDINMELILSEISASVVLGMVL